MLFTIVSCNLKQLPGDPVCTDLFGIIDSSPR